MVNVKRDAKIVFGCAAPLADVPITMACLPSLAQPIMASIPALE